MESMDDLDAIRMCTYQLNNFSCTIYMQDTYNIPSQHPDKARTGRPLQVRPRADNPCKLGPEPKLGFPGLVRWSKPW